MKRSAPPCGQKNEREEEEPGGDERPRPETALSRRREPEHETERRQDPPGRKRGAEERAPARSLRSAKRPEGEKTDGAGGSSRYSIHCGSPGGRSFRKCSGGGSTPPRALPSKR